MCTTGRLLVRPAGRYSGASRVLLCAIMVFSLGGCGSSTSTSTPWVGVYQDTAVQMDASGATVRNGSKDLLVLMGNGTIFTVATGNGSLGSNDDPTVCGTYRAVKDREDKETVYLVESSPDLPQVDAEMNEINGTQQLVIGRYTELEDGTGAIVSMMNSAGNGIAWQKVPRDVPKIPC
jgi:hypothetical protein